MEKENWPTVTSITRFIEYLEFSKVLIVAFFSCLYQLDVHGLLFCSALVASSLEVQACNM